MIHGFYNLVDGVPVPANSLAEWDRCHNLTHALRDTVGTAIVSTVFLGIDHNFSGIGPPVLWETMIFGSEKHADFQARYSSQTDAAAGHLRAVAMLEHEANLKERS